jgi:hypothetical protein
MDRDDMLAQLGTSFISLLSPLYETNTQVTDTMISVCLSRLGQRDMLVEDILALAAYLELLWMYLSMMRHTLSYSAHDLSTHQNHRQSF